MSERRSSRRDESGPEFSRRRVLGATALGVAGAGGLLASVAPVRAATTNFGAVAVGTSRTREITTDNPVSRPLEVTDITITGADAAAFSIVGGDAPLTVGPNESHTVRVAFEPTSTGEKSAQVRVETTIRSAVAGQLAGRGVEEGAASTSGEEESGQSSDRETSTKEPSEADPDEESSNGESSTDDSSSGGTEADGSDEGSSSDDESSPGDTTASDADESDEGTASTDGSSTSVSTNEPSSGSSEPSATDDTDTESASGTTETDGASATRTGTDADSDTDSRSEVEDDPGALLTELLDVNDDGVVNLRDLLRIARRFG
jgi:hypothetical protein